ncbi:site-specific DNA-methyltransferase [Campylobacter cuniculorum]|uniref:site-specific DNA-methyltransferase n=1 Tax=Campylobacter cuniculorum TaxID=374106 RepID=UPI0023F000A4|nr:site-specific DNA-methyltransferase [Campylobacter cuniculorum]
MDYKQAFFSRLEDCYLGVKVKAFHQKELSNDENYQKKLQEAQEQAQAQNELQAAQNGFSNLMQIKYKYFNHIKDSLEQEIDAQNDPWDCRDIYNKLYTFFDSYLNDTGTPFFKDTPMYKNIYAKIYSNSKDTNLFYKTQNLYYVKSDTLYQSLILDDESGEYEVVFDASDCQQNKDNTKNKIFFKFENINTQNDKTQILIKVTNQKDLFSHLTKVYKDNANEFSDEFNKTLKTHHIKITEEELKKIFRTYKKQQEIDFFIHKDAKSFLEEQFDLWMFAYLYKEDSQTTWDLQTIQRLQTLRKIAFKVIEQIAHFENELKALWLKPKFAKNTQYVFSLDLLHSRDKTLLESLSKDKGFEAQIAEWKELHLLDENFSCSKEKLKKLTEDEKTRFLPLDTKHFSKENRYKILSCFEDLESILNGTLIKSDNFQALNTLRPKYQGKIDLIYIDPPYNTGNDGFIYADDFNHSSWLSLMENRLELAKELLSDSGSMFISIDDKEQARLKITMDAVFGEENFVANFVWQGKYTTSNDAKYASNQNENIFCFTKNIDNFHFNLLARTKSMDSAYKNPDNDPKGVWKATPLHAKSGNESNLYAITFPNGISWNAPKGRYPRYSKERLMEIYFENGLYFNKNGGIDKKTYLSEVKQGKTIGTFWGYQEVGSTHEGNENLAFILDKGVFNNPKPEKLLKRICEIASKDSNVVLDFFAGSGTTCAVAQKLGRKYIGVEMGEHFYHVILPRMKKVLAGFQSGISKECDYKGGGAFCYYELESYEEALNACEYVLDENHVLDYRKSRKLIKSLDKTGSIKLDMSGYRGDFDIFVTLSNLMGLKIKRLFLEQGVESCEFDNGACVSLNNLDLHKFPKLKNLIWWESTKNI